MSQIINLTPHPVKLIQDGEIVREWDKPSSEIKLPRLIEEVTDGGTIDGVPIKNKRYGRCENLPQEKPGTYYIVSGLIASALRRSDLLVPNTVRDEQGKIIGCDSFAQIEEATSDFLRNVTEVPYPLMKASVEVDGRFLLERFSGNNYKISPLPSYADKIYLDGEKRNQIVFAV